MAKKVAILVVNPVNGFGLFQYLESFFENGISYKTFAVAETRQVKTNSGVSIQTDEVIANLKGHEDEYDVLVFSCGDAIPKLNENVAKQFNKDMFAVINSFNDKGKILVGHCAAALVFDKLGIGKGKKVAMHQLIKPALKGCIGTDEKSVVDGNLFTAQTENTLSSLMPELLNALK
jgi:putative intracellular protease/amidase